MPWIHTTDQFDDPQITAAVAPERGRDGALPPMLSLLSLRPRLMLAMTSFRDEVFAANLDSGLTRLQLDMIAAVVATTLRCRHCAVNHAERAVSEADDLELAQQLKTGYRGARLTSKELVMLEFAELLTADATNVREEDIAALREAGWRDEDIVDIVHQTALLNYQARLANGLGIEISDAVLRIEARDRDVVDTSAWGQEPKRRLLSRE